MPYFIASGEVGGIAVIPVAVGIAKNANFFHVNIRSIILSCCSKYGISAKRESQNARTGRTNLAVDFEIADMLGMLLLIIIKYA